MVRGAVKGLTRRNPRWRRASTLSTRLAADEAPAEDEGDAADDGGESADEAPAEAEASEEDTAGDAGDEESGDASEEQES